MKFPWSKQPPPPETVRVLLVCMGNICRSPMAEGVLRQRLAARPLTLPVEVDSAGTHGYHDAAPPDPRAQSAALRRGIDISKLRARQVEAVDFIRFDLVLVMDEDNRSVLLQTAAEEYHGKIRLLLEFSPERAPRSVPDPYYGGSVGFERVLDMVEESMPGLLDEIERLSAEKARRLAERGS
ncbi:MAG: low molecular weight protein-tyrosine-phosphatase [Gammaproteobacteria bacterium]